MRGVQQRGKGGMEDFGTNLRPPIGGRGNAIWAGGGVPGELDGHGQMSPIDYLVMRLDPPLVEMGNTLKPMLNRIRIARLVREDTAPIVRKTSSDLLWAGV